MKPTLKLIRGGRRTGGTLDELKKFWADHGTELVVTLAVTVGIIIVVDALKNSGGSTRPKLTEK